VVILLVDISGYSIREYWCLLIGIILVAILLVDIGGYEWTLVVNNGYYISGYWWLFC